ncbi:MAG: FAD-binding oxidoreductase, partial [Kofleriaceae bacterium]
ANDLRYRDAKIDISDLTEILEIDPVNRICIAESGVTFVDLVTATMQHGLLPIVVPELKTITIGGAVAGCSIESMSYVHGGFHDTCIEYEVITATGDVLTCRRDNEHALVFQMVHGTFGTLGIVARLTFKLVPAKPYVKLVYERYTTLADYQTAIRRHYEARDIDFMDGIIHSPTLYVLSAGTFVDRAPYTNRYDWVKVYYVSTRERAEDYLTTEQYVFRYDRGVTNVRPKSLVARILFGKAMASSQWLRIGQKLHWALPSKRPTVTLDVFVPFSKVPAFLEWYEREFNFYPLWCVPYRRVHDYEWLDSDYWKRIDDDLFLDLAIYGMKQPRNKSGERRTRSSAEGDAKIIDKNVHRMIEEKLRELGGIKTLIAHNYYPEHEFWSIWSKPNYDAVKAITDPKNLFRDLYTKTCKAIMGLV